MEYKDAYSTVINVLPNNKQEINSFMKDIRDNVDEGELDALDVIKLSKILDTLSKGLRSKFLKDALDVSDLYDNSFGFHGVTFTKTSKSTYDYSVCNDEVIDKLDMDKEAIVNKIKDRQGFLKSLKEPLTLVDEETGDVITICSPAVSTTSTLQTKIA